MLLLAAPVHPPLAGVDVAGAALGAVACQVERALGRTESNVEEGAGDGWNNDAGAAGSKPHLSWSSGPEATGQWGVRRLSERNSPPQGAHR